MKKYQIILLSLFLIGCSASGPLYTEHVPSVKDVSVVYIYRPIRTVNCCVAPAIYIDGVKKVSLKNGGYSVFELAPGKHEIKVGDGSYGFDPATVEGTYVAGTSYYFKWVIGSIQELNLPAMYADRDYHLIKVQNDEAKSEISSLRYTDS